VKSSPRKKRPRTLKITKFNGQHKKEVDYDEPHLAQNEKA
jgi:hypothetical protein